MMHIFTPLTKTVISAAVCAFLSTTALAAATQGKEPLPLQEIRQFTDVYSAIKAYFFYITTVPLISKAAYYLESSACGEPQLFYRSLPLRSCNVLETLFKCIFLL